MYLKWKSFIPLLLILTLISGCFGGEKALTQKLEKDANGKIKVFSAYGEQYFNERYGKLFSVKYPNIEFEVIDGNELDMEEIRGGSEKHKQELKKLIDKHQPDVMLVNQNLFTELSQNNKLYNLDTLITQDNFDIKGYMDGYIDMVKNSGNGHIYGLSPIISPQVMLYNADLFKEHGVSLPSDKMTWQSAMELANRFTNLGTGENKIYGFEPDGGADSFLHTVSSTWGLRYLDAKGEKLLLNSEGWKQAFKLVTDAVRNKAIYTGEKNGNGDVVLNMGGKFLEGKVAMRIAEPYYINEIKNKKQMGIKEKDFDWGMVTAPVDPALPNESRNSRIGEFFTINANAQNLSIAWEFVKFFNSPEKAKSDSKSIGWEGIPTRNQFFKEINGKPTDAFYLLKPKEDEQTFYNIPNEFTEPFFKLLDEALQSIIDNKKTVDEGVNELQQKGQEALIKARVEEKARKEKEQAGAQKKAS